MGNTNSQIGDLRSAILSNDVLAVGHILAEYQARRGQPNSWELLWQPLNRKGDAALSLAARRGHLEIARALMAAGCNVNLKNRLGETALDVALNNVLPSDGDILHHHFCPYSHPGCVAPRMVLPEVVKLLMRRGAQGASLEKLIMHAMRDSQRVKEVIDLVPNLTDRSMYKISGLLLQTTVWFHHIDNLETLLKMGVPMENFWSARFMPDFHASHLTNPRQVSEWPQEQSGEFHAPDLQHSDSVQSLKFSFVQDWCADWDDGENPDAQFRAGLHMTPDGAIVFARAAGSGGDHVLMMVMNDVMSYVPEACSGPELNRTDLIGCLLLAGYTFNEQERIYLQLVFNIDFKEFQDFLDQPKTLKHLSRLCIRQHLSSNVYYGLERLDNVPRPLKDYILLKEDYPPVCVEEVLHV